MSDSKYWIIVVDDDVANLMMAGNLMSKHGMRVTALKSGKALLEYIEKNEVPDLCLLDIKMPDMDGFETLRALRTTQKGKELPVVFLTADESERAETTGLSLGAMDFIKKPFVPEILVLRARHIIDLVRLQKNLAHEVEVKTEENHRLFVHVVSALAAAIDAKDIYTNGHSGRVAKYAKEIARRFGYDEHKQNDIYMMGLLHDVGKIGVPDAIIKKSENLTDEEIEKIKEHPIIGAHILSSINEMPSLAFGAKYHHERYDGTGYPNGLAGEKIPEQARIIAVADSYDSRISRGKFSPDDVRDEIEKGKGTKFDPKFADIMLSMIDEGVKF
ncbi:MAG: response regulator [Synergistaceae bacterium]|nr:response regulator [Synergistaceae bacterium]